MAGNGDTIAALSSGALPAGVAIVRVSGPAVREVIRSLVGEAPKPRHAAYGKIRLKDGSLLDNGLTIFFPGPQSFTGEDCVEFHIHGGRASVAALLRTICGHEGCRLAEAGEFMRRAFGNGKIDLLATEAIADLLAAETEGQRRFAIQNGEGGNSRLYASWREQLIRCRALIEADLDFSDEQDVPGSVADLIWNDVTELIKQIETHMQGFGRAEILREGFDVVLLGAPNAGKSTLLNTLAKREAAIVTPTPGTTRDLIEVSLDLDGIKTRITDTAGLRETEEVIEKIGIERALERARKASLLVVLEDIANPVDVTGDLPECPILRVGTKSDTATNGARHNFDHVISAKSGEGISELINDIRMRASLATPQMGELMPWRERHMSLLGKACEHLSRATRMEQQGLEVRSEELRLASKELGKISGTIDVEDMLDVIFSQFCIGK